MSVLGIIVCAPVGDRDDESAKHTHARMFNPRYAAPEVFARRLVHYAGVSFEDEKPADSYAFGVIMWEILTRQVRQSRSSIHAPARAGDRGPGEGC